MAKKLCKRCQHPRTEHEMLLVSTRDHRRFIRVPSSCAHVHHRAHDEVVAGGWYSPAVYREVRDGPDFNCSCVAFVNQHWWQ